MAELRTHELVPIYRKVWETELYNNAKFLVKLCYISKELNVETVRLYDNELKVIDGAYIELVDWNSDFYNKAKRVLYKYHYVSDWKERYVATSKNSYLVPVSELTKVTEIFTNPTPCELQEKELIIEKELEDPPMSAMTLRDYVAVHLQLPVSSKSWINDLIVMKNGNNTSHSGCCSRNN